MPGDRGSTSQHTEPVRSDADTEERLLATRAGEGDEEAFETLVRRHGPGLVQLAARLLGSHAEAEDVVQDGFVGAWRKLPEFRGDSTFRTWMYRIVTNRCLNVLRRRQAVVDLDSVPEPAAPEHTTSPVRTAEARAAMDALAQAIGGLSPEQRVCWIMRELQAMPYETIADLVGISPQAVRGRVFRARRHLTEAMVAWR